MRRGRGRPRKIRPAPTHEERAYHRKVAERREQHIAAEPVLGALRAGAASAEVIRETMLGLARESAALRWDREAAEEKGSDAALIATRRIDALGKLASIVLTMRKLAIDADAVSPATMVRIRDRLLSEVDVAARQVLAAEQADALRQWCVERLVDDGISL